MTFILCVWIYLIFYWINFLLFKSGGSSDEADSKEDIQTESGSNSAQLYARGDEYPHKPRRLTFRNKTNSFTLKLGYDDASVMLLPPGN